MSIKLDWEVEVDRSARTYVGEDPAARRRRYSRYLMVLVTVALAVGLVLGGLSFLVEQVEQINEQVERDLRDTVQAEVTALRLNDWTAFAGFQRSATEDWLQSQRSTFETYQTLLADEEQDVRLTGRILDVEIDDPRARVQVEEIINGVPYTRVWFYWYYEEDTNNDGEFDLVGWRHVPPDFEFWGDGVTLTGPYATVAYRDMDAEFAPPVYDAVNAWVQRTCGIVTCEDIPPIRIQIVPDESQWIRWTSGVQSSAWVLVLPSPYADKARTDMPFSPEIRADVAQLLAQRLVLFESNERFVFDTTDAYYVQQSTIAWLAGQFAQFNSGAYLVDSIATYYGEGTLGKMLREFPAEANISALSTFIGVTLDQAPLDWRDFLTWRLQLEHVLINDPGRQRLSAVTSLYDTRETALQQAAEQRYQQGASTEALLVVSAGLTVPSAAGEPQLAATVRNDGDGQYEFQLLWRLVENNWLRAS